MSSFNLVGAKTGRFDTNSELEKKYELLPPEKVYVYGGSRMMHRIKALRDIGTTVKAGDIGGYVENQSNLSQQGNCWVYHQASVYDGAVVAMDGKVANSAQVSRGAVVTVDGIVSGNAFVTKGSLITDRGIVRGNAVLRGVKVYDDAVVEGNVNISCNLSLLTGAHVKGKHDYFVADNVGTAFGTLSAYRGKDGQVYINRGCFIGTLKEFKNVLHKGKSKDSPSPTFDEYLILADFIELRFNRGHILEEAQADNNEPEPFYKSLNI